MVDPDVPSEIHAPVAPSRYNHCITLPVLKITLTVLPAHTVELAAVGVLLEFPFPIGLMATLQAPASMITIPISVASLLKHTVR